MSHADLTLAAWAELSDGAALRTAGAIARATDADLVAVTPAVYAGRSNRVALFDRGGMRYALVPGGTVTLGHQPGRRVPSARQRADFAEAASEYRLAEPIDAFVATFTSPARTVTLAAALVAVRSTEAADLLWDDDDADDSNEYSHADLTAGLARQGVRPPTPDEWEYACGAGAATLFRWGDDYPDGEPYGDVPLITRPNLFGLVIADDPYRSEFTTDPAVLCGGDGGSALCGGYGPFLAWITLATAYRDPDLATAIHDGGLVDEIPVRPVLPLS